MKKLLIFTLCLALGVASLQLVPAFYPLPSEEQVSEPEDVYAGHAPMGMQNAYAVKKLLKTCSFGATVALTEGRRTERGYYRCLPTGKWMRVADFSDSEIY